MAMMTKNEELKALETIRAILDAAGADSYIGIAFEGCVRDAEDNIGNDFGMSMKSRYDGAMRDLEAAKKELATVKAASKCACDDRDALRKKCDELETLRANTAAAAIETSNSLMDARAQLDAERCHAADLESENVRLKARLYDLLTASQAD